MTRTQVVRGEIRSGRDEFAARLRRLGATDDQVAAFDDRWDELGAGVRGMSDDNLRAVLADMGSGFAEPAALTAVSDVHEPVPGVAEDTTAPSDAELAAAAFEADEVAAKSIPDLTEWVGDNPARAAVAYEAEVRREGGGRAGALDMLRKAGAGDD
jgi:hypothetical protein